MHYEQPLNCSFCSSAVALRATAELQKLQKLDNKTRSKIFAMMRDTTLAQVWPHVSLRDDMNAHLWTKPDKKGVSKLSPELGEAAKLARKKWVALNKKNPEAAKLLIKMAKLTKEIQKRQRAAGHSFVSRTRLAPGRYNGDTITVFRVVLANPLTTEAILVDVLEEQCAITEQQEIPVLIEKLNGLITPAE